MRWNTDFNGWARMALALHGEGAVGDQQAAGLGREDVANPRFVAQEIADPALRQAGAIEGRGIEIADAGIPRRLEQFARPGFGGRPPEIAERRAAKADPADLKTCLADRTGRDQRAAHNSPRCRMVLISGLSSSAGLWPSAV